MPLLAIPGQAGVNNAFRAADISPTLNPERLLRQPSGLPLFFACGSIAAVRPLRRTNKNAPASDAGAFLHQ